ncbi:MAG: hypothetical protein HYX25_10575, partial [Candidatus Solibacter usitatus]|nr:hypothetical protein [Candidatus Solibacter usitatus]
MTKHTLTRWAAILFLALLLNTAYIAVFASPTIFYMANVLLHLALGVLLLAALPLIWRKFSVAGVFYLAAAGFGIFLAVRGNVTDNRWALNAHIGIAIGALVALLLVLDKSRFRAAYVPVLAAMVILPASTFLYRRAFPNPNDRIRNPLSAPASPQEEGGGPQSPFFPSSARTNVGGIIPANFFMDSEKCGECHKDIYDQWNSSAHHFASFNNQFYRKSIEYMQAVNGTQSSKWCAGCHDHAVFFNGRFERPIKEQIDTPEARAGLACTSCHSIVHVDSSMGNGGFTISYPPLHELANSKNRYLRAVDR